MQHIIVIKSNTPFNVLKVKNLWFFHILTLNKICIVHTSPYELGKHRNGAIFFKWAVIPPALKAITYRTDSTPCLYTSGITVIKFSHENRIVHP